MMVLVVDDTDSARDVAERILRFHGVQTMAAKSGEECLSILQNHSPDLVLLDISMPDMDGLSLLEQIRLNPDWRQIPVVMLTAISDKESVGRAMGLGASAYLVKADFNAPQMIEVIRRCARHETDC